MLSAMRLLVCGGTRFTDRKKLWAFLDWAHGFVGIDELVHGDAPGADTMADEWGKARLGPDKVQAFPADWSRGRRAGPERNSQMLRVARPDWVIAAPGANGTEDMVAKAEARGVPVTRIR